ncbi:hypothetical protein HY492_03630 [Candidatus Woesearchaeota archaeon]|nr:hypothetical protein [Candidatus Woesearchaeota archaeon]
MKKTCLLIAFLLVASVSAHEDETADSRIGPSSFLWSLDLFFEKLNVWLTFDGAEKTRLHLAHAAERVEEAEDASATAMERVIARRETDLASAKKAFESYDGDKAHVLALASDARTLLNEQREQLDALLEVDADTAQLMLDQNDAWAAVFDEFELPVLLREGRQEAPAASITGEVVAELPEKTEDIVLPSESTPSESGEQSAETDEAETNVNVEEIADDEPTIDDGISIVARTQGGEITRINVTIGDMTKGFVLSVIDQNATLHEITKRFNLTEKQVIDNMDWEEG